MLLELWDLVRCGMCYRVLQGVAECVAECVAVCCSILERGGLRTYRQCSAVKLTVTQHIATHYNTLQHCNAHCNTQVGVEHVLEAGKR